MKRTPVPQPGGDKPAISDRRRLTLYACLFVLCLLTVFYVVDYRLTLIIVCLSAALSDRKLFLKADYGLLLTFVCFFVFVGNVGRIEAVRSAVQALIQGRELLTGIIVSQSISNVPAAVLLSGFTKSAGALVLGTNIGGLGTPVASLASLISLKLYLAAGGARPKRYLAVFTAVNVLFLAILTLGALML
jgi:Na+/H+ antiporter NhaD/arsenite permease-like protein